MAKKQDPVAETTLVVTPEPDEAPELTLKQRRFVDEYLIDLNATQAAIRTGYVEKTAHAHGHKLKNNPVVAAEIARLAKERHDATVVQIDELLLEYSLIARSDILNYLSFEGQNVTLKSSKKLSKLEARAISKVSEKVNKDGSKSISFELHSKLHALDSLAKYYKLFVDQQVNVNVSWVDIMTDVHNRKAELKAKAEAKALGDGSDDCTPQT